MAKAKVLKHFNRISDHTNVVVGYILFVILYKVYCCSVYTYCSTQFMVSLFLMSIFQNVLTDAIIPIHWMREAPHTCLTLFLKQVSVRERLCPEHCCIMVPLNGDIKRGNAAEIRRKIMNKWVQSMSEWFGGRTKFESIFELRMCAGVCVRNLNRFVAFNAVRGLT